MQRFIIIDGNALFHRAWHALPATMKTSQGELVNAVFGFTSVLLKVIKDLKPEFITVCFDRKEPTFRHKAFEDYKAHRKKPEVDLYMQLPRIKEILKTFKIPIFEKSGYEADDLIGTLASLANIEIETIIVTGDLDALQLINDHTSVYTLKKGISETMIYNAQAVKERYDLQPEQLIDFKALRGDPSDNIPGVKGIGEKTASELIKTYGSLEKLYAAIESKEQQSKLSPRVLDLLLEQKKEAFMSKKLVTIVCDLKLKFDLEKCRFGQYNFDKTVKLFQKLEFRSLLVKLQSISQKNVRDEQKSLSLATAVNKNYHLIDTPQKLEHFLSKLEKQKIFAIDTEATTQNPLEAGLLGMSFSWKKGEAYYISPTASQPYSLTALQPILRNKSIKKIGHNIKYDIHILKNAGFEINGVIFDTMIAAYLLNPGERGYSLDALSFKEFGHKKISFESLTGTGKDKIEIRQVPIEKLSQYACEDADFTFRLYKKFKPELEKKILKDLFQRIEMPLVPILAQIESYGVQINAGFLQRMEKATEKKVIDLEEKIFKISRKKFNINSPLQLKEILFKKLKISTQGLRRTKTGISTAAPELKKLQGRHKIISLIFEYRELAKLLSTYIKALPKLINEKTGRLHTSFNQTITATGRLSSSDPNLQNIPIRTKLGREIRKAFVAPAEYSIVAADYSQIELRIVASLANDPNMIKFFNQGKDIHSATASELFDVAIDKVSFEQRRKAKEANFGVLYGLGARGLAQRMGLHYEEAVEFIVRYFLLYQNIKKYIDETKNLAHTMGYVETLFGRRRYLPAINSNSPMLRAQAERMAVNAPIQGTAADLIKVAMIKLERRLAREYGQEYFSKNSPVKMLLQVHDELVFEIKNSKVKRSAKIIKAIMESVYALRVPIEVEVGVGKNWEETKEKKLEI